jgi:hypothetical protein
MAKVSTIAMDKTSKKIDESTIPNSGHPINFSHKPTTDFTMNIDATINSSAPKKLLHLSLLIRILLHSNDRSMLRVI